VLDYRQQFQKEPVVWSLGALSAGFALGYTLGYSHKVTKRGKQSQIGEFADGVVDELSKVGQNVVMPALNEKITELFGFDFRALLQQMRGNKKSKMPRRRSSASKRRSKKRQPHLR
jgi:hypothetical protein